MKKTAKRRRRLNRRGRIVLTLMALLAAATLLLIVQLFWLIFEDDSKEVGLQPTRITSVSDKISIKEAASCPVTWQVLQTSKPEPQEAEEPEARYSLTDEERHLIAQVVTAEAGGEPYAGKLAVAQCILRACEDDDIRPDEAVVKYEYTSARPEPTEEALEAVADVFDMGNVATSEPIKFFYAPALVESEWHESQLYVMTINGHRFFKEETQ